MCGVMTMSSESRPPEDRWARDRLTRDVPAIDERAKARAFARLRKAQADEEVGASPAPSSPERRWVALVGALVGLSIIVTVAVTALPPESGGPRVTAASELRRLARVASSQAAPPQLDRYPIVREALLTEEFRVGSTGFTTVLRQAITGWIGPDGSGRRRIEVLDASFATPQDEEAWRELGSPDVLAEPGDVTIENYGPGELQFYDLDQLPLDDTSALREAIQSGALGKGNRTPENLFSTIGSALTQPDASPEVRAALFRLASTLEGVRLLPQDTTDPLGRPGVGVALASSGFDSQIIVDPGTSRILARVDRPLGGVEGPVTWTAYLD
jgi:hypothetical protein